GAGRAAPRPHAPRRRARTRSRRGSTPSRRGSRASSAPSARPARRPPRRAPRPATGARPARAVQLGTLVRLPQTYKSLARLREIGAVVAKYGFGDLLARLELEGVVERARNLLRWRRHRDAVVRYTTEERIRLAFEELGTTFVKLGQILATR